MKERKLNKREWLLLSAYLDGELSPRERRQVEELLQTNPASRTALEGLRRTKQVLKHSAVRKVPRDFTLTEEMVRKPFLPSFSRLLSYSSALAGILLVVVFALDLSSSAGTFFAAGSALEEPRMLSVEKEAPAMQEAAPMFDESASPELEGVMEDEEITPQTAAGMGGGPPAESENGAASEEVAAPASGMGGGGGEEAVEEGESIQEEELLAEEAPEMPSEKLQRETIQEPAGTASRQEEQIQQASELSWGLVEVILGLTTFLTGLAAFLLRKRA